MMMSEKYTDEYIYEWYEHLERAQALKMAYTEYARVNKLDIRELGAMRYKINYRKNDSKVYDKFIALGKKFIDSGMSAGQFAKIHDISKHQVHEVLSHMRCKEVIDRKNGEKKFTGMKFISLPVPVSKEGYGYKKEEPEQEILEKQNDIEIIISKGVKVSISPNIDTMKVIKIIELLKDL